MFSKHDFEEVKKMKRSLISRKGNLQGKKKNVSFLEIFPVMNVFLLNTDLFRFFAFNFLPEI